MTDHHVIVIGAGYAGCMAANRLQATGAAQVTLVDPHPQFVERIRLHQLAAGTGGATIDFSTLLHRGIERVQATVGRIDASSRTVHLADERVLTGDAVIYAVGSGTATSSVPGADDVAYRVGDLAQAQALAQRLATAPDDARVVVVGGGLTGVEVAAEFAQAHPARVVTLVCGGSLVPSAGVAGARSVSRRLRRLGVEVITDATVSEVHPADVVLGDGRCLRADITVWTTGFAVPQLAADSGLAVDEIGRLRVDDRLVSETDPWIVGAGDAVVVDGMPLRMSCQSALPLGAQAAATVTALLCGARPDRVSQGFAAQCIGLGRGGGTVVLTDRRDRPRRWYLGGRAGGVVKEQVCRMTVRWITGEGRRGGSYSWPSGPKC
ncbi:NAD(P)/FAD-dependent oxidoreductase [Williamsia sp. CHRR-6]|uniref:NAD(P)/FAD-dependent oxidoreductase n=1 Tax=Williamsia sp. CHRR-6 TaxID=2835871 RepID=UPI001BD92EFE|nr:FAD-dependent oxidoreductase [Williamsia sp. CHRR-6]MBT0566768.1 FAD-dependent oxidoreductase [Williamsia sp. CHRR-6]